MSIENTQIEFEITRRELEVEQPIWSALKTRAERSGWLDSTLNHEFEGHNLRVDYLLSDLYIKMGQLGIDENGVTHIVVGEN